MRYNKTWFLSDIVGEFLNHLAKDGVDEKPLITVESMVYSFILDKLFFDKKESAFPLGFAVDNHDYYDTHSKAMAEAFSEQHLNGAFNIEAVNIWNCNIGLLVAVVVNSKKYPEDEPLTEGLCSKQGKLCYVFNFTYPQLSELGNCFFMRDEDNDNAIIRIG